MMASTSRPSDSSVQPTTFLELNGLLAELCRRVKEILDDDFVGAYLQGSFAVGDADMQSDCDFLIPVARPISRLQEAALRVLHDQLPTRPDHWSKHLEGSYPLLAQLSSLRGLGVPWLFIDHGWRQMQWSTHCNSEVAGWSLRERGVVLDGPDPKTLLDPVPADALRQRMRRDIPTAISDMQGWISLDIAWAQRYAVTTLCRMLYTLDRGEVTSKKSALTWAGETLEPRWQPLFRQVDEDRALGFDPDAVPRDGSVSTTLAFAGYAQAIARR